MAPWLQWVIGVGSFIAYFLVGAVVAGLMARRWPYNWGGAEGGAVFIATIGWPIAVLPALVVYIYERLSGARFR